MLTDRERAERLVRAIEASLTGDVSSVEELFAPGVAGSSPVQRVSGRVELAIELEDRDDAFSQFDLLTSPLEVGGGRACVEWVASAVHTGPLRLGDADGAPVLPATGRRVVLRGVTVAEFVGPKIASFRHYWDEAALLEGLGLLPPP